MKKLAVIIIIISLLLIPVGSEAQDLTTNWQIIKYNDSSDYEGKAINQSLLKQIEAWHSSSGFWRFYVKDADYTIDVKDKDIKRLQDGVITSEDISKEITLTKPLPNEVVKYVSNGGDIKDIKVKFDNGKMLAYQIFSGDCKYLIEGNNIKIKFTPIFNVSTDAIYGRIQDPNMKMEIPQGKPGFGYTVYAIWSKSGKKLGSTHDKYVKGIGDARFLAMDDSKFLVAPDDIKNANGDLKENRKYYYVREITGEIIEFDSSEAGIGYGTFKTGGAVGIGFLFPINVTYYIPENSLISPEDEDSEKPNEPISNFSGDIILPQKFITKAFDLTTIGGLKTFKFIYGSAGNHNYTTAETDPVTGQPIIDPVTNLPKTKPESHSRSTAVDNSYKYVIEYSNTLNKSAIATLGQFIPTYNNTNILSGTASYNGGSGSVKPNFYFTAWRGKDIPTIASYKESSTHPLLALGLKIGKTPQTTRNTAGGYQDNIEIKLDKSNSGDYSTTFKCSHGDTSSQTHTTSDSADYKATVAFETYIGKANTSALTSNFVTNSFSIGGTTFNKATGYAIPNTNLIKFYPYVEMAYELPMRTNGTQTVNVLAAHESSIKPVDYVDIGWFNSNNNNSLTINSNQWSTHKRAVDAHGKNSVLPGGAIFTLDTKNMQMQLGVTTWQTYIPSDQINNVTDGSSYYTSANAVSRDTTFNDEVKKTIESLNIVQYVDSNANKLHAFDGTKITGAAGQNVYGNKTSSDAKYKLVNDSNQNKANEADLDVISSTKITTHYKVRADVKGNVIIEKSTNGTTWSTLQTLTKTQTAANITNAEAKELENRTKIVSNFIGAIDRNQGNDPSNGGAWYNEAWDGICVLKTDTVHTVGLKNPAARTAALDPKLCPPKASQSDLFTKYYISQFRLNDRSTVRAGKPAGFAAEFKGVDILIPSMQDMYRTRPFYIPNATVQDLVN